MYYSELNGEIIEISVLSASGVTDAIEDAIEDVTQTSKQFPEGQSNAENALDTLEYMGKGMLGIFLVTTIIIVSVVLLNKFTSKKSK